MSAKEQVYLDRYRELTKLKNAVEGAIADIQSICASAGNWRKVAEDLAAIPVVLQTSPWHEDRLRGMLNLRTLLVQYGTLRTQVTAAWSAMSDQEKIGLALPSSLDATPQ